MIGTQMSSEYRPGYHPVSSTSKESPVNKAGKLPEREALSDRFSVFRFVRLLNSPGIEPWQIVVRQDKFGDLAPGVGRYTKPVAERCRTVPVCAVIPVSAIRPVVQGDQCISFRIAAETDACLI